MYGRLGYYHYLASTQIHMTRDYDTRAETRATTATGATTPIAVKPDRQTLYVCCACVAAILGSFGLVTCYALMIGA